MPANGLAGGAAEEVAKLRAMLEKLPGKENAKKRHTINKKIRRLQESGAAAGGGDGGDGDRDGATAAPVSPKRKAKTNVGDDTVVATPPRSTVKKSRGKGRHKHGNPSPMGSPMKSPFKPGDSAVVRVTGSDMRPHDFRRLNRVGKGTFATCYAAESCDTGETVCLKVSDLCAKRVDPVDVRDELNHLRRLHHPNCLSLIGYSIDIRLVVTMVVEFCPYSLEDIRVACDKNESIRTRIHPTLARQCMTQVIQGVKYLHSYSANESIGHFDIKPDNIMSTVDGVLKIADFGLAVAVKGKKGLVTDGLYRGTDEYMAPEVSEGESSPYGLPADVWSLGVTMYELVFGRLCKPERESFSRRLMEAIVKANLDGMGDDTSVVKCGGGKTSKLSALLVLFFAEVFKIDPDERATIEQMAANPLFQFSQAACARAVVEEIDVVEKLKAARTRARKEYGKRGALSDLELESSSESESEEEDDDDEEGDDGSVASDEEGEVEEAPPTEDDDDDDDEGENDDGDNDNDGDDGEGDGD